MHVLLKLVGSKMCDVLYGKRVPKVVTKCDSGRGLKWSSVVDRPLGLIEGYLTINFTKLVKK